MNVNDRIIRCTFALACDMRDGLLTRNYKLLTKLYNAHERSLAYRLLAKSGVFKQFCAIQSKDSQDWIVNLVSSEIG